MAEQTSSTSSEDLEPTMQLIMLIAHPEAFAERGETSEQDCTLDIRLTYAEWLAIFFDALGMDKTAFDRVKSERYSSQNRVIAILGEFDEEIPGFPILSRIRGPYNDVLFKLDEVEDLRQECLRVKATTANEEALGGLDKLLAICERAHLLALNIYFVSN